MYNTAAEKKAIEQAKDLLRNSEAKYFSELSESDKESLAHIFFKADRGYESLGADNARYNRLADAIERMLLRPTNDNKLTMANVLIDMLTSHYEPMVDEILMDMRDNKFANDMNKSIFGNTTRDDDNRERARDCKGWF